ncbi:MAG: translation initiation factor IF-2 subunit beta [Candidatus Bathyarchaeia archaeon]
MKEYTKLLDRALAKVPKKVLSGERFEYPNVVCATFGNKTIIYNFAEISNKLNRNPSHILKFLSKEMATAGTFDGTRAVFQGKFSKESISRILNIYCDRHVICPICKRPDTSVKKEDRFLFLVCEACGAKSSIVST